MMVGPAIDILAGTEGLGRGGELDLERFRIDELLGEGLNPPLERLARDRARAELVVARLVEEHAAAVPRQLVPRAGQLLEADARDPLDRIVAETVLLGLAALLEQFVVGLERLEVRLLHQV